MVKVLSQHLKGADRVLLRRFVNWSLRRFVKPSVLAKSTITFRVISSEELSEKGEYSSFKDANAWVTYQGLENDKKKFIVTMCVTRYNKRAKKPWVRLKNLMTDAAHECIHIKQYLNNELFDYVDGKARFKGEVFGHGHSDDLEQYFNSPWEIEAYGRQYGLYKLFTKKLKQELKEKAKK
jgi:hypothetical protein